MTSGNFDELNNLRVDASTCISPLTKSGAPERRVQGVPWHPLPFEK